MRPSLDAYKSVPGWCSDIEAAALQEAARDKMVLEIGVWKGRSTIAIAATSKHLVSVDHFYGDEYAGASNPRQETIGRLQQYQDVLTLCISDWIKFRNLLVINSFDFIYYDACHTYEATKDFIDWIAGYRRSFPDMGFGLHDVDNNPSHAGVKKALEEYTTNYTLHDRLAIVR